MGNECTCGNCECGENQIKDTEEIVRHAISHVDGSTFVRFSKGNVYTINGIRYNLDKIVGDKLHLRTINKHENLNIKLRDKCILKSSNNIDVEFSVTEISNKKIIVNCLNVIIPKNIIKEN